jgi:hypothetical protein
VVISRGDVFNRSSANSDLAGKQSFLVASERAGSQLILLESAPTPDLAVGTQSKYMVRATGDLNDVLEFRDEDWCALDFYDFAVRTVAKSLVSVGILGIKVSRKVV